MKTGQLGKDQIYYIKCMLNGDYLETDGMDYWLVENGNYIDISTKHVLSLLYREIIAAKRIDDDTTRYFLTDEAKSYFTKNRPQ